MKCKLRRSRASVVGLAAGLVIGGCAAIPSAAPTAAPAPERGVLFLRLGPDTMFVERFELSPTRMYVESVVRAPRVAFRTIDATLNPDGSLAAMAVATFDPANPRGGSARDSVTVGFSADSTIYTFGMGAAKQFLRLPGRADVLISLPGNLWFPNYVLAAARAPRVTGDSIIGIMSMRLGAFPLVVKRVSPDTVTLWSQISGVMRVMLGPDGRLAGLDGTNSSIGYVGTRVEWIDIDSVSRAFAERERAAGAFGTLSARDTVRASVAGAEIAIDYGRPSKRGRQIFGNVVPWDRLWRTGANLATHFTTDKPLYFDGASIPAGTHTLYSIPSASDWTLLVSSETGQWGSAAPDPARFFARIPMRVSRSPDTVETFTISVVRTTTGGVLRLAWDDTVAEAGFSVR